MDPLIDKRLLTLCWVNLKEDRGKKALSEKNYLNVVKFGQPMCPGVAVLTAGIDTQDDRFEIEVVGWGRSEESCSLLYDVIEGDGN